MGNIVGGLIGGVGSLLGGNKAKSDALTGFNYLSGNATNKAAQGAVPGALAGQTTALGNQNATVGAEAAPIAQQNVAGVTQGTYAGNQGTIADTTQALLTGGPNAAAAKNAFGNYLGSTGYQFQKQQGMGAITGSAATRGLLNSGATAKAATTFGQGLASTSFNNYLGQLGQAGQQQGATATSFGNQGQTFGNNATAVGNQASGYGAVGNNYLGQAQLGVGAANNVATAGTQGGQTAAGAQQSGTTKAGGILGGIADTALGFFGL